MRRFFSPAKPDIPADLSQISSERVIKAKYRCSGNEVTLIFGTLCGLPSSRPLQGRYEIKLTRIAKCS